jgi:hypothetical protein
MTVIMILAGAYVLSRLRDHQRLGNPRGLADLDSSQSRRAWQT